MNQLKINKILFERANIIKQMRLDDNIRKEAVKYYKDPKHAVDFIADWGMIQEPRNPSDTTIIPFQPFQHQYKTIDFILDCYTNRSRGLIEKSRDMGITWICCALSIWFLLFQQGISIGWGSRKESSVDSIGNMDSIFEKMRFFLRNLPSEFIPFQMDLDKDMSFMRIVNKHNDSSITGEVGDNIGRGGRKTLYFKDESAHYLRPEAIEASLTSNTDVQIDLSSVHGTGNVFHRKRMAGEEWMNKVANRAKTQVLILDWREHPHKTQQWYDEEKERYESEGLGTVFSSEIDRDYSASVLGVVIHQKWITAAIGLAEDLKIKKNHMLRSGLDVADDTRHGDKNALCHIRELENPDNVDKTKQGLEIAFVYEWGERDTVATAKLANKLCLEESSPKLYYDSVGMGAGIRAQFAEMKRQGERNLVSIFPWAGSHKVLRPHEFLSGTPQTLKNNDGFSAPGVRNKDYFHNLKAQAWWTVGQMFFRSYQLRQGHSIEGDFISISKEIKESLQTKIIDELSRPTYKRSISTEKIIIDKSPDDQRSPNIGDSIVIACFPSALSPVQQKRFVI